MTREVRRKNGQSEHAQRPTVRQTGSSVLDRTRTLMEIYLHHGSFDAEAERTLRELLASELWNALPKRPGGPLQNSLFLLRESIASLDALRRGNTAEALDGILVSILLAEGGDPSTGLAADRATGDLADPFDGLLYVLGARLASCVGDSGTEAILRERAHAMRQRLRREGRATAALLSAFLGEDEEEEGAPD